MNDYHEYGLRAGRPTKKDGPRPRLKRRTFTPTERIDEILRRMTGQNPHLSEGEIIRILVMAGAARVPSRLQHPLPIG